MYFVRITWFFRLKSLDTEANSFLHKALCMVRGDQPNLGVYIIPESLYAPDASPDAILMIWAIFAAEGLVVEGGDMINACLHGDIEIPIIVEQPTDSTGIQEIPGHVRVLKKSICGTKQAEKFWDHCGSLLVKVLLN